MEIRILKIKSTKLKIEKNLITKIEIHGGTNDELLDAIRYYRVVRDAPTKKLDYKKAYKVLHIYEMLRKYR